MIIDCIDKYELYQGLGDGVSKALEFLVSHDLEALSIGKHEIDGQCVYALVSEYETKPADSSFFERHELYVDVQYVVRGEESIGYAPLQDQVVVKPYHEEHDYALHSGNASFVNLCGGMFAIFFPGDLHMPGISDVPGSVRKIVVKVKA
ncbi:DUF386 domain-containing protein [Mariprofundus erugo]|uniref:DUF386 domain-containing protein n=1 Tax=Mariprofundus erugo TaxID=2528639 RepID=A0A5R9GKQ4_9PROT|nr:YhcH/YjgK/YiaL family protein [Mariprofundus erugo]TLS66730.1 DUF386 domain-containing protein [Mariprofundus erugo]